MIQVEFRILSCFFNRETCRFAEICKAIGYPTDLGGYYIRRLVKDGYLEKSQRGAYSVTPSGKRQLIAGYGSDLSVSHPRMCGMIVARQQGKYVVLERDRQPFIGVNEWPAGMVLHGEPTALTAQRLLAERLGVQAQLVFAGMFRRTDMYKGTVFDDKLFAIYTCDLPPDAVVIEQALTGKNLILHLNKIRRLAKPSRSLLDILAFVSAGNMVYEERVYGLDSAYLFVD